MSSSETKVKQGETKVKQSVVPSVTGFGNRLLCADTVITAEYVPIRSKASEKN